MSGVSPVLQHDVQYVNVLPSYRALQRRRGHGTFASFGALAFFIGVSVHGQSRLIALPNLVGLGVFQAFRNAYANTVPINSVFHPNAKADL